MSSSNPEKSAAAFRAMWPKDKPKASSERPSLAGSPRRPAPVQLRVALPEAESLIAGAALLVAVLFNLVVLYPEVAIRVPSLNDMVLHTLLQRQAVAALLSGQNLTDPWMGTVPALGYPLFHYYQHLPFLPLAALSVVAGLVSRAAISPVGLVTWTAYLLLSLFPLAIYWSMRRFGFSRLEAAFGGLASCLISTNFLYGLEYGSYIWRGSGMYTMLWGMFLLPLALAQCYVALREGRGYLWAVLLVAATILSHVVAGYVALGSLVLLALLVAWEKRGNEPSGRRFWRSAARLILLLLLVAVVISYFLVPFLRDGAYMNRSVWELQEKYDSYGAPWVLASLAKGQLLDFGRFPSLTLLAAAGTAICLWRGRREPRYRIPVALALLWLLLYFGRPTWGALLDLLPMSRDLHLHRLIMGFHLGAMFFIGIALAAPWRWALSRRDARTLIVPVALTALLLFPVYRERAAYLDQNRQWMVRGAAVYAAEEKDLAALEQAIASGPAGRVYAGLKAKWGGDYKIDQVPMYAELTRAGLDVVGFLYTSLSLNSDVMTLFNDGLPEQFNLFNIRYVVTPNNFTVPAFYKKLGDFGRHRLYQVETTGYFDLVGSDLAFAGDKSELYPAAVAWLKSGLVGAKQHPSVYLGGSAPDGRTILPLSSAEQVIAQLSPEAGPSRGRVISETVESNAYAADVEVAAPSLAMLKATYHPNWHAIVDGVEAPTVMLMPSYIGVPVAPGQHHIRLEYRAGPLRGILMAVGLLTLVLVAASEWLLAKRRRRADAGGQVAKQEGQPRGLTGRLNLGRFPGVLASAGAGVRAWKPYVTAKAFLRPHLPYVGAVLLMALLAGLPLFQLKMMSGHDARVYLTRAVEFYQGLRAGQIFPRWAPDLNFGYGEPIFSFVPPLIYYLMVPFRALGTSFVAAQDLACFLLLCAGGLGMYLLATELFGRRGGLIAAAAYLFAPYMLGTLYVRQALADFSAFAAIPFAFWGLYRLARNGRARCGRYRFLLAGVFAVALLLLSSNTIALIAVPALLAWVGWLGWRERSPRTLLWGFVGIALGLALSAFFWLPALAERGLVQTARAVEGYLSYRNHFVYPSQFVVSPWGYGLSLAGPADGMSFTLGPVHLIAVAGAFVLLWRMRGAGARGRSWLAFFLALLAAAVFFASTLSQPLWDRMPLLQYLQFPWRFLTLAAFSSALLCGAVFASLSGGSGRIDRRLPSVALAAVLVGLLLWGLPKARPEKFLALNEVDYSPQAITARGIGVTTAGEYAPVWVQQRPTVPAGEPLTFVAGQGRVVASQLSVATRQFIVEVVADSRLRLNTFYFPGWTLFVDSAEQPVDYDNPQGVMEFSLGSGLHGVKFVFADSPVRAWAGRLSLLALLLLVGVGLARVTRARGAPRTRQVAAGLVARRQGLAGATGTGAESEAPKQSDELQQSF